MIVHASGSPNTVAASSLHTRERQDATAAAFSQPFECGIGFPEPIDNQVTTLSIERNVKGAVNHELKTLHDDSSTGTPIRSAPIAPGSCLATIALSRGAASVRSRAVGSSARLAGFSLGGLGSPLGLVRGSEPSRSIERHDLVWRLASQTTRMTIADLSHHLDSTDSRSLHGW